MFDVRPVDQTGDLDWKKIQSVSDQNFEAEKQSEIKKFQIEKPIRTYILGVGIENENAPIFHDPEFDLDEILEYEVSDDRKEFLLESERKRLEKKQKLIQEKIRSIHKEKEAAIIAEKIRKQQEHEKFLYTEALRRRENLKKIAENNRKLQEERENEILRKLENEKKEMAQKQMLARQLEEKERKEKEYRLRKEREQQEFIIKAEKARKEKEKEEFLRAEALRKQERLRKIAEDNFRMQKEREAVILKQRKELERQKALWLEEEQRAEKELRENETKMFVQEESIAKNKSNSERNEFSLSNLFFPPQFSLQFDARNSLMMFATVALVMSFMLGGISYASKGFGLKGKVLGVSQKGLDNLSAAVEEITQQNFENSSKQFSEAYANFSQASQDIDDMGGVLLETTRFIPFASKVSSGRNAVEAGKHFSAAGQSLNEVVKKLTELKNPQDASNENEASLLNIFKSVENNIADAKKELDTAQENLDKISIDDLPEDKRDKFLLLKQKLPEIRAAFDMFLENSHIFVELLGGNGPRKYLFLFQNNSEMRPTGGFIGSYGLLDMANGHVKKFFIDGIFNPDGQLREKIVPPLPIQKISATWSMHDSNWFPDFTLSAKKAIYFYEKTGGPTADGVITLTPTLMQELLEITGPIEMPDYGVTLDSENFTQVTQYEVEVDYDKEENKPKKILSDLAPIVLEKLLASKDIKTISKTINVFMNGLKEKHVLLYFQDKNLENIVSKQGWSGEILPASKDYLSVINTNINGFKTDAVVEESINHKAEIQRDGSVIDTVTITRKHKGGDSEYDWFNKVNADYMRVYVPEGSKLMEVSGQTRETNKPSLDYDALGFKRDSDVQNEENNTQIDPESGTRVYNEAGKTVFANWVYVSPQETVTISYKYLLPFSLFKVEVKDSEQIDSYSLIVQKQSGSTGSLLMSDVSYPENYSVKWSFPDDIEKNINDLKIKTTLERDHFKGVVFEKNY